MEKHFEDLIIRQEAENITIEIYQIINQSKDFWFRDQIQRASTSIMNNIAQWYDRESEKDKAKFFIIAKSSCAEVRSMLRLWYKLWYFTIEQYDHLKLKCFQLSKMISKFIDKFQR